MKHCFCCSHTDILQNDEIEKLGLERSAIYRRCRLEEIKLPLIEGNLRHVPMEEVRWLLVESPPMKLIGLSESSRGGRHGRG